MRALGFALPLFAIGCVPTVADDLSTISAPRVLAVKSTPAEVGAGEGANLDALVASDETTVPPLDWRLCVARKPLAELGPVNPACLDRAAPDSTAEPLPAGDETALTVPMDACSRFGPNPPVSASGQAGGRPVDPDPTGGFYQPVVGFLGQATTLADVRIACGPGDVPARARVAFNQRYVRNENPEVDSLFVVRGGATNGVAPGAVGGFSAKPSEHVLLRATWAACSTSSECDGGECGTADAGAPSGEPTRGCTGAESYAYYDASSETVVDRRESILVTWYATAGAFDAPRTAEAEPYDSSTEDGWTAPAGAKNVTFWVVIRDDRGGVSWQTYGASVE